MSGRAECATNVRIRHLFGGVAKCRLQLIVPSVGCQPQGAAARLRPSDEGEVLWQAHFDLAVVPPRPIEQVHDELAATADVRDWAAERGEDWKSVAQRNGAPVPRHRDHVPGEKAAVHGHGAGLHAEVVEEVRVEARVDGDVEDCRSLPPVLGVLAQTPVGGVFFGAELGRDVGPAPLEAEVGADWRDCDDVAGPREGDVLEETFVGARVEVARGGAEGQQRLRGGVAEDAVEEVRERAGVEGHG